MKTLTGCLIVLTVNTLSWAQFGSMPSSNQTQASDSSVPQQKHKKHKKAAVPAGSAVTAASAVKAVLPSNPVINALDDVVLESGFAGQQIRNTADSQTADSQKAGNPPLANPTSANLPLVNPTSANPTLRAWAAGMLIQSSPLDVGLSGGIASFRAGSVTDVAPEVALRIMPFDTSRWGWELGGILPHGVSGALDSTNQTQGTTAYDARLSSCYEIHAAGIHSLPHGDQNWAVPEIGLGLSFLHVSNDLHNQTPVSWTYQFGGQTYTYNSQIAQSATDERWSVSPFVRLGVVLFPQSLVSLRVGMAYIDYANTAKGLAQTFDLGLQGVMLEELVQVRL
jgi:hypothetical protein